MDKGIDCVGTASWGGIFPLTRAKRLRRARKGPTQSQWAVVSQSKAASRTSLSAADLAARSPYAVTACELELLLAADLERGAVMLDDAGGYRLSPLFERRYGRALREIGSAP